MGIIVICQRVEQVEKNCKKRIYNSNLSFKEAKEIVKNYKENPNPSQISWIGYHNENWFNEKRWDS